MIAIYFLLGLIIFMQTLVLVGVSRTNYKLNELKLTISTLNDLIVPTIGINSDNAVRITRILDVMADTIVKIYDRKKKKEDK